MGGGGVQRRRGGGGGGGVSMGTPKNWEKKQQIKKKKGDRDMRSDT